jgi:hypothetical protein
MICSIQLFLLAMFHRHAYKCGYSCDVYCDAQIKQWTLFIHFLLGLFRFVKMKADIMPAVAVGDIIAGSGINSGSGNNVEPETQRHLW